MKDVLPIIKKAVELYCDGTLFVHPDYQNIVVESSGEIDRYDLEPPNPYIFMYVKNYNPAHSVAVLTNGKWAEIIK